MTQFARTERAMAFALDLCVDRILHGQPCDDIVGTGPFRDHDLAGLVDMARRLVNFSSSMPGRISAEGARNIAEALRRSHENLRITVRRSSSRTGERLMRLVS